MKPTKRITMAGDGRFSCHCAAILVALLVLPLPLATARNTSLRSVEERYHELVNRDNLAARDLYKIAQWCLQVADKLPARERDAFRERSRECIDRAETMARGELGRIFSDAESEIAGASGFAEGTAIRERADRAARTFIESLLPVFQPHTSMDRYRPAYEAGIASLERAMEPLHQRDALRTVRKGKVLLGDTWVPFDEPFPPQDYLGVKRLSRLYESPEHFVDSLLTTEFITKGEPYDLLHLTIFDGFDDAGNYLVPNFMTDRLVLALERDERDWRDDLVEIRKRLRSEEDAPGFRFRVLVRVRRETIQHTNFYLAAIQQIVVFDEQGNLVEYLGPHPGGSR